MARDKVILAYSGGLDTSVMVPWIGEKYNLDVVAFTVDLGQGEDIEKIRRKALRSGAVDAVAVDARNLFVDYFVFPALMAGAVYEGKYPLATALGRPLIAKLMVDAAREQKAKAVAHGCTGKGNDQVRFDVTFQTLAPDLQIIAPVREWKMSRPEALAYAAKHNIPVEATVKSPFSIDQNLFGRSCEAGVLEDPWDEPPPEAFAWTAAPQQAPRFKTLVSQEYADLIYNGLWFSAFHQDLFQFVASNQRYVSGLVRMKLFKGKATVVGRKSEHSLYNKTLATYESGDQFSHEA